VSRQATVPTTINIHQALNALEKIVNNPSEDDKARFTLLELQRLAAIEDKVNDIICERRR
jgi:hypothetical protein